eukprot:TRINITY_DN5400_c0_g1_i1.p1 TRINITY_DN5400_c0_g1~~TRINITY_DN5400_c0_g1_i1.p1  ORF type:complete len:241 (+),score=18.47 TRINITY_DN5400_c0_g1_i1:124-846(+)
MTSLLRRIVTRLPRLSICSSKTPSFKPLSFNQARSISRTPVLRSHDAAYTMELCTGIDDHAPEGGEVRLIFRDIMGGKRYAVKAQIGQSLAEVAKLYGMRLTASCLGNDRGDIDLPYAWGPTCCECHIYIDAKWAPVLPERHWREEEVIMFGTDCAMPNSRLACMIDVTKHMDGMEILIPKQAYPTEKHGNENHNAFPTWGNPSADGPIDDHVIGVPTEPAQTELLKVKIDQDKFTIRDA